VSRDRLGLCVDWLLVQAGDWGHIGKLEACGHDPRAAA
jgi:hypothetical protein